MPVYMPTSADDPIVTRINTINRPEGEVEYLYRYEASCSYWEGGSAEVRFHLYEYQVLRRTPKGCWILLNDYYWPREEIPKRCQKFVLDPINDHCRRWAYPDKTRAWESFSIRKHWRKKHLTRQLRETEWMLQMIDIGTCRRRFGTTLLEV